MTFRVEWLHEHMLAIAVAFALALAAWKRPNLGRGLFGGLFLWASAANAGAAVNRPWVYLDYANLTESPTYRSIIDGPFARHITTYVLLIAMAQLCIGVGMLLRGNVTRAAVVGAIVFLLAIAPLGIGSGFPSTVIMAVGAGLLLKHRFELTLFAEIGRLFRGEKRRSTA